MIHIYNGKNCEDCKKLWKKLKQQDEEGLKEVKQVLFSHIKQEKVA